VQERRQDSGTSWKTAGPALVLALDLLPVPADGAGRLGLALAEDVRVAAHELLGDAGRDAGQVARSVLGAEEARKNAWKSRSPSSSSSLAASAAPTASATS
jgi:hypothetical protein